MTFDLSEVQAFAGESLLIAWIVFLRVGAVVSVLPTFGEQSIPVRVRLGVAFAFTLILMTAVPDLEKLTRSSSLNFLTLTIPETITGLFFGILLRFFVFSLQIAGSIAAQSTSLSQIFGGTPGIDPQPAIANLLVLAGLCYAAMMGLHVHFSAYILYSYEMVPIGALINPADMLQLGLEHVSKIFSLGFSLAAPFVIASLLYNVILGVINRAMPQLMVSFVGAPAITAGGLFILAVSASLIMIVWWQNFEEFLMMPGVG